MTKQPLDPKDRPLTVKERKLVKGIAEGKPKRVAAMEVYNAKTIETAGSMASEALRKPNVQLALAEAFERHGITIDAATKPIADGLQATRDVYTADGDLVDSKPDHAIRLKASGLAFNLMGVGRGEGGGNTFNFFTAVQAQAKEYDL